MKTPLLERLIGGFVWRPARPASFSSDAGHNELATAALASVSCQRLALVSLGQGDFIRNLIASTQHARGRSRRGHRPT